MRSTGVYLRHSTVHKHGKTHTYWRLVRSVRQGSKVRQETVAQLGELDAQGRADALALARHMTGRAEQYELFEDGAPKPTGIEVRLDRIRVERARGFGDVWLGWTLWRSLQLKVCTEQMADGREAIAWSTMAVILMIARLCEPSSELHIAEDWFRQSALEDLLGVPADQVNDDRLYRALDHLLIHKSAIEQHLRQRLGELFALDYDLLLYDGPAPTSRVKRSSIHKPSVGTAAITAPTANRYASHWWSHARASRSATKCSTATAST